MRGEGQTVTETLGTTVSDEAARTRFGGEPPASNTGATFSTSPRWDYSATTHTGKVRANLSALYRALGGASMEPVGGLNGWKMGEKVYGSDGNVRGTIYHGGREDLFTLVSGGVSDEVREAVCSVGNARTSRVDTRIDTLTPFADLAALLAEAADRAGTRIITIDSRVRGVNLGRTVYLGAPTSRIRVRLYEKWLEAPGEYAEGTNRVEVQLRPDSGSKAMVSGWSRPETFACSPMTRRLADLLGLDEGSTVALQTGRRKAPDLDRSIAAMGRQYGRATREFLHRYDGDVSKLLGYLAVDEDTLGREVLIEGP